MLFLSYSSPWIIDLGDSTHMTGATHMDHLLGGTLITYIFNLEYHHV